MGKIALNLIAKSKYIPPLTEYKTVLENAVKIGLAPKDAVTKETSSLISKAGDVIGIRAEKAMSTENIGVLLSDGTLKFSSEEEAIEYGKKKILEGLNSANPHEINVDIAEGGRVLGVIHGDASTVGSTADINEALGKQIKIAMHGHPDIIGKGVTTAISTMDYSNGIQQSKNLKKMIVYNSKGEYYILEKLPTFNHDAHTASNYSEFVKDYYSVILRGHEEEKIYGEYTRKAVLDEAYRLNKLYEELVVEFEQMCANRTIREGQKVLNERARKFIIESFGRVNIGEMPSENYRDCVNFLDERACKFHSIATDIASEEKLKNPKYGMEIIKKSHEFWKQFGGKYGVEVSTNFSHFS